MSITTLSQPPLDAERVSLEIRDVLRSALIRTLPGLYLAGFLLVGLAGYLPAPLRAGLPGVLLILLPLAILGLHKSHYLLSVWLLVLTCTTAILLLAAWGGVTASITLLALPIGLAALYISIPVGVSIAALASLPLLFPPVILQDADPALRFVTLSQIWGVVGIVWLMHQPLLTTMEWYRSGYRQSRKLLDQARDDRLELSQALQDLAGANLQLRRLNRLAQTLRKEAEEARKAKEQFVANVSHELRTPLNMIIGFLEIVMQSPETYGCDIPQSLLADLSIVLRNSHHLSGLIDDVLDLSRIDSGKVALRKEPVVLKALVEAAIIAVRPLFDSKQLYLQVDVPDDLPPINCDRIRIRQVILNLLSNAGRHTERGGVHVCAWQEEQSVVVSVTDTGPGIAAEKISRIFQPFFQADGADGGKQSGSGLGLSISKSYVELHDGTMWMESELGKGTTFFFRLPIENPSMDSGTGLLRWFSPYDSYTERTDRPAYPVVPDRPRLVVLDRNGALRKLLTRYLDSAELVFVTSLEEALEEVIRHPAQALLVNDASTLNGLQRIETAANVPFGLPVFICSVPGIRESADALGACDYLIKPITREALIAVLERLQLKGKTILAVDDDPDVLRLFHRILTSSGWGQGCRVLRARSGIQAIQILRQERPDAVLLDLIMPEMDGFQFLAEIRDDPELCDVPVVVVSAQDLVGQPILTKSLAVTLGSGISAQRLLATIEGLIGTLSSHTSALGIKGGQKGLAASGLAQESGGAQRERELVLG
jgi:signal transduction histidine kinase/DNA-binding response OmpR family regulator